MYNLPWTPTGANLLAVQKKSHSKTVLKAKKVHITDHTCAKTHTLITHHTCAKTCTLYQTKRYTLHIVLIQRHVHGIKLNIESTHYTSYLCKDTCSLYNRVHLYYNTLPAMPISDTSIPVMVWQPVGISSVGDIYV